VTEDLDPAALRSLAPEPFAAWDVVVAAVRTAVTPERGRALGALVAALLDGGASGGVDGRPSPATDDVDPAVLAFAEQFVLDVSSLGDDQRSTAMAALGADAFPFVQALYVADLGTRMHLAWEQLFGTDPGEDVSTTVDLWTALETFMASVARLSALDPLTTEIVRLRGARAHNCRLCKSLRNVRAANDGADEQLYDEIDHYEASSLSERHRAALRVVDAMVWQPAAHPATLRDEVRASFTDVEVVELVLDVARNAANKIAVAFAADAPHVDDGLEFYDIDPRGELVYGLMPER
jgi:alkylhydroperoxidase family enzyme